VTSTVRASPVGPGVRRVRAGSGPLPVVLAAAVVAAVTVAPLIIVVAQALPLGWSGAGAYLFRPRMAELLGNTVALVILTVPLTILIGVGAAWLVERCVLPGVAVWRILLLAPLAVPAFVASYAWSSAWPSVSGLWGAVFVTTLAYYPFVYLPVAALLRTLDQGDVDSARALGETAAGAALRVVLPHLRPALCGGALLVALHLLAEFGVMQMLRFSTLTTAIVQQYAIGFSDAAGSMLATVLIALCLLVLVIEVFARGRTRIARVGRGTREQPVRASLGRWTAPVLAVLTALVGLGVIVPVAVVLRWLLRAALADAIDGPRLLATTGTTLLFACLAGLAVLAAALPGAWLLDRRRSAFSVALERLTFVASALPGVVVGLALVTVAVHWARPIYQTVGLVVLAYLILFVPRAVVTWRAGLAAVPPELAEAGRSLGAGGVGTFTRVVLPIVAPSALTGFVLVFLATATELTATLLLAPTGTETLATAFWAASDELDYVASAPYAAVLILLSAPLTLLLHRRMAAVA
jgi:iron(III) transport system permease protein